MFITLNLECVIDIIKNIWLFHVHVGNLELVLVLLESCLHLVGNSFTSSITKKYVFHFIICLI